MLFVMPVVRPFRLSRLVFTYLIPLIPLTTLWDGLASCMRVYSPDELRALTAQLPPNDYEWDVGTIKVPWAPIRTTYLFGMPRRS